MLFSQFAEHRRGRVLDVEWMLIEGLACVGVCPAILDASGASSFEWMGGLQLPYWAVSNRWNSN